MCCWKGSPSGPTIPKLISNHGAIPGIKVDKGAKALAGSHEETVTEKIKLHREVKETHDRLLETHKKTIKGCIYNG